MADVRLHRTDGARVGCCARVAEDSAKRLRLERVADGRAGAVCLHVVQVGGGDASTRERLAHHRRLHHRIGDRHSVGAAILVDGAAHDHGVDIVAIGEGGGERLEHDDTRTFAAHVPVCRRVECATLASGRDHGRLAESDGEFGVELQLHATDDGEIAFAGKDAAASEMRGGE